MAGIIVDIDGTLLDSDGPIQRVIDWVNDKSGRYTIYIVTGRPESRRAQTTRRLREVGVKYNRLYMNNSSSRNSVDFKRKKGQDLSRSDNIVLAIENNASSRDAYRESGIRAVSPSDLPSSLSKTSGFWEGIF